MRERLGWIRPALLLGSLAVAAVAGAQLIPLGDEFQVNTYTTAGQQTPQVAVIEGGFVVVWESRGSVGDDTEARSIQAQRFDTSGQRVGSQFQINQLTGQDELGPRLHGLDDGGFVVQWSSTVDGDVPFNIYYARTFDAQGVARTGDFPIVTGSENRNLWRHAISQLASGDLISAYGVQTTSLAGHMEIGTFDLEGNPGKTQIVHESDFSIPAAPSIERSPNGSFVVAWVDESSYNYITGRRLNALGNPIGAVFRPAIGSGYSFVRWPTKVDFRDDGKFVVAWAATSVDLYGYSEEGVRAVPYEADGTTGGSGANISVPESPSGSVPAVEPLNDGNFLVVWSDDRASGDDDVLARVMGGNGQLLGAPQQLSTSATGELAQAELAASPDRQHFLVVWTKMDPGGGTVSGEIQGRFFRSESVFGDGFESGDASRWSSTSPP